MRAEAFVHRDGTGTFTLEDGTVELVSAGTPAAARREVLRLAGEVAAASGRAVEVDAIIDGRRSVLHVSPDGDVLGEPDPVGGPVADAAGGANKVDAFLAGLTPVEQLDAGTLAAARLLLVAQVAGEPAAADTDAPDTAPDTAPGIATVPVTPSSQASATPSRSHRRRALLVTAAAATALVAGTGIALAASGRHGTPAGPAPRPAATPSARLVVPTPVTSTQSVSSPSLAQVASAPASPPSPSPATTQPATPAASSRPAPAHHASTRARPNRPRPAPKPTRKPTARPKVHASIPASPLGRRPGVTFEETP